MKPLKEKGQFLLLGNLKQLLRAPIFGHTIHVSVLSKLLPHHSHAIFPWHTYLKIPLCGSSDYESEIGLETLIVKKLHKKTSASTSV